MEDLDGYLLYANNWCQDGFFMKSACCCSGVRFDVRSCSKLLSKGGAADFSRKPGVEGRSSKVEIAILGRIIVSGFL
jgi:hypothetical protein